MLRNRGDRNSCLVNGSLRTPVRWGGGIRKQSKTKNVCSVLHGERGDSSVFREGLSHTLSHMPYSRSPNASQAGSMPKGLEKVLVREKKPIAVRWGKTKKWGGGELIPTRGEGNENLETKRRSEGEITPGKRG